MKKSGKNITKAREAVEKRPYLMKDAVTLLQKVKYAKFDETVEITMRLGVDPKHADQMVRGTVVLPHGLGKSKRVLVIATGDKIKEAEAAGADFVGGEEMVEKINKENWTDFDALNRHARRHEIRRPTGKSSWAQGSDAQSENGHCHVRCWQSGAGSQSGQSGISNRQDGAGSRTGRQDFVHSRETDRQCHDRHYQRGESQADRRQGKVREGLLSQLQHGPGNFHRHQRG